MNEFHDEKASAVEQNIEALRATFTSMKDPTSYLSYIYDTYRPVPDFNATENNPPIIPNIAEVSLKNERIRDAWLKNFDESNSSQSASDKWCNAEDAEIKSVISTEDISELKNEVNDLKVNWEYEESSTTGLKGALKVDNFVSEEEDETSLYVPSLFDKKSSSRFNLHRIRLLASQLEEQEILEPEVEILSDVYRYETVDAENRRETVGIRSLSHTSPLGIDLLQTSDEAINNGRIHTDADIFLTYFLKQLLDERSSSNSAFSCHDLINATQMTTIFGPDEEVVEAPVDPEVDCIDDDQYSLM